MFAKASVILLENQLTMSRKVYRAHESEFTKSYNGFKVGETINIRKPNQATYRDGAVASPQDISEGYTQLTVNKQGGYDFVLTSAERALKIEELSERVIKPAMIKIADKIDRDLMSMVHQTWNWVGTPGSPVNTYSKFLTGTQLMNDMAFPDDGRSFCATTSDRSAILGAQSGMYVEKIAGQAYRRGDMGEIDGVGMFWSQNVPSLTTGTRTNGAVNGAAQNVAYSGAQMNTYTQALVADGFGASATIKAGEVFTIAGVYAVNPISKETLPDLQRFVVTADATASGGGAATLTIAPAIITSGAFQTVSAVPADNAAITWFGSAGTTYKTSFAFHKNAFALAMVPLAKPEGAVGTSYASHKGFTVRVQPYYDGTNDKSCWRLDVLYGYAAIDPRLAVRING